MINQFRLAILSIFFALSLQDAHANRQQDLDSLRQRIAALQQEMEKASDTKSETTDALRESERAISNSNRMLYKLAKQQREAGLTLGQYQQQTQQISQEMQGQQLLLAKLLHQQYLGGKQAYFTLLLNKQDPNQTARELRYYEYIAQSRANWLREMRANLLKLDAVAVQAQQKNAELATLQAEQNLHKKKLLAEKSTHQQVLKKISQQLKQQRQQIGRLQRDENRMTKLLEKLSSIAAQSRSPASAKVPGETAIRTHYPPFTSLKGKLALPVKGKIINTFGARRPDSPVLWKGLFVRASASQPIAAVAPGRVIYADWLRGFGNLLIIDHGLGYMSLYGNNETLYKQVGDELQRGETIAAVGNSGGNENYGLYFELRHEGIPLNPAKWMRGRTSRSR